VNFKGNKAACADVPGFLDEQKYPCSEWEGYDCSTAASEQGLTAKGQADLMANCKRTCGLCDKARKEEAEQAAKENVEDDEDDEAANAVDDKKKKEEDVEENEEEEEKEEVEKEGILKNVQKEKEAEEAQNEEKQQRDNDEEGSDKDEDEEDNVNQSVTTDNDKSNDQEMEIAHFKIGATDGSNDSKNSGEAKNEGETMNEGAGDENNNAGENNNVDGSNDSKSSSEANNEGETMNEGAGDENNNVGENSEDWAWDSPAPSAGGKIVSTAPSTTPTPVIRTSAASTAPSSTPIPVVRTSAASAVSTTSNMATQTAIVTTATSTTIAITTITTTTPLCRTRYDARAQSWGYQIAEPGTPCIFGLDDRDAGSHCIDDQGTYGLFGWCFTSVDKRTFGSCDENCPLWGPRKDLNDKIDAVNNRVNKLLKHIVAKSAHNSTEGGQTSSSASSAAKVANTPASQLTPTQIIKEHVKHPVNAKPIDNNKDTQTDATTVGATPLHDNNQDAITPSSDKEIQDPWEKDFLTDD